MIADEDIVLIEEPQLSAAERLYLPQILGGLGTTFKHLGKSLLRDEKVTIQYPEEKRELRVENYRGVHRLNRDPDDRVACVACFMCSTACPAHCIHIEAGESPWPDREKYPVKFDIDELRCIYCGMCEEACPVDAIELTTGYDLVGRTREEMILDKEELLAIFDQTKQIKPRKNPHITGYPETGAITKLTEEQAELLEAEEAAGGAPVSNSTAFLLYAVFAFGGIAVYFLLPRGESDRRFVGPILGTLALAAWLIVMALKFVTPNVTGVLFYLFATVSIAGTARVITHPKPFYSAIYFVLVVVAVTALLILQKAEFLAVSLIIIYAGAILVTYLFLIMLAQQSGAPAYDKRAREPFLAVFAGFVLMAAIAGHSTSVPAMQGNKMTASERSASLGGAEAPGSLADDRGSTQARIGNTYAVGEAVMTQYVVALQIAGVLLLISMVGAVALSRKHIPMDIPWAAQPAPLGQAGREAEPY